MASIHIEATASSTRVVLTAGSEPSNHIHAIVRRWPGWRRDFGKGFRWSSPFYPSAVLPMLQCRTLRLDIDPQTRQWIDDMAQSMVARDAALTGDATVRRELIDTSREPKRHQWQAIEASRHMDGRVLLADDMGLGKTSEALWIARAYGVKRVLIVCPVSVKYNWEREIGKTLGDEWDVIVIGGSPAKRANQFVYAEALHRVGKPAAVIINYDLLIHMKESQLVTLQDFVLSECLILDESHYVKSRRSQRTKIIMESFARPGLVALLSASVRDSPSSTPPSKAAISGRANSGASVRILCSGTPVRNMVDDLYSQIEILRPGTWTSWHDFETRYLKIGEIKVGNRAVRKIVGTKNVDELNAIVNTVQIRRKKEEAIDLPPKTYTFPELELTDASKRIYKAMREYTLLKIDEILKVDGDVNIFDTRASSAVDAMLRCEQIAQGFIGGVPDVLRERLSKDLAASAKAIPGRPKEIVFPSAPKLVWAEEAIASIVRQGGAPIVFSRFNGPMFWLRTRFESFGVDAEEVVVLHGGLSAGDKDAAIEAFQGGESRVLLVQVKMAEGFNLTRSQDVLFFGRDWSPAINVQAEDRAHRIGQTGTVNVQIPIVRGTIETRIHRVLESKQADAEQALRHVSLQDLREML